MINKIQTYFSSLLKLSIFSRITPIDFIYTLEHVMIAQKYTSQIFLAVCATLFLVCSLVLYRAVPSASSHLDIDSVGYDIIATHFEEARNVSDPRNMASIPFSQLDILYF